MCGRLTFHAKMNILMREFAAELQGELAQHEADLVPRYNIAPSQDVYTVRRSADGKRTISAMQWGLIPSWAKDKKLAQINARAETASTKPMFRSAHKSRRCLVLADGYYEWLRAGKQKQPYLYETGKTFAIAGLWESWQGIESCALITTEANKLAAEVHDRMPVILHANDYDAWLDTSKQDVGYLLAPYADEMTVRPVSQYVNNARNEGPECVEAPKLPLF